MKISEKLYECICHLAFGLPSSLGKHVKTHFPCKKHKEKKQGKRNESYSEAGNKHEKKTSGKNQIKTNSQLNAKNPHECKQTNIKTEKSQKKYVLLEENLNIVFEEKRGHIKSELEDNTSPNEYAIDSSLEIETKEILPAYQCVVCSTNYDNISEASAHSKIAHKEKLLFKCMICEVNIKRYFNGGNGSF